MKPGLRLFLLGTLALLTAWSIAGMQLAAGAVGLAFLAARDFRRPLLVRQRTLAFCGWCALSVLLSPARWGSFQPTAWIPALLVWVGAAFALELEEARLQRVAAIWVGATAVASVWAWVQAYTGLDLLYLLHLRRAPFEVPLDDWPGHHAALGFFNSRLTYAHALLVPLGVAAAQALKGTGRIRVLALALTLLLGSGLVLSFARAAWWGALVGVAVLVLATRARRAALAAGVVVLLVALALPRVRERFASGLSPSRNPDRLFIWDRAREVIADHPVLGVGFGAYPQVAGPYYDRASPIFPMHTWCHDTPLSLLAELGPLGLGLYVWLWLGIYGLGRQAVRKGSALALGLLAGTLALHVASLFHDVLYDGEVAYALYLGGALLSAVGMQRSVEAEPSRVAAPGTMGA
jgi:O-antigen ligase